MGVEGDPGSGIKEKTHNMQLTVLPAHRARPRGGGEENLTILARGNFLEFLQQVLIQPFYAIDSAQVFHFTLNFFLHLFWPLALPNRPTNSRIESPLNF